jgi:hypothetical protein
MALCGGDMEPAKARRARMTRILDAWVTGANGAAEQTLTSIANEVRALCRAEISGK